MYFSGIEKSLHTTVNTDCRGKRGNSEPFNPSVAFLSS